MELSYKNDPALKALHIAQAEHHAAADMLIAGTFGEEDNGQFRGCSVGCFAHEIDPRSRNYHATVAEARGLPEWLVYLQDAIFENLPADERASFHVELAKRIPVGVDLAPVPHLIAVARIDRMLVIQRAALEAKRREQVHNAIGQVVAALEMGRRAHVAAAGGNSCELSAAESAAESARSAAWSAAWSAVWISERDALFAVLAKMEEPCTTQ